MSKFRPGKSYYDAIMLTCDLMMALEEEEKLMTEQNSFGLHPDIKPDRATMGIHRVGHELARLALNDISTNATAVQFTAAAECYAAVTKLMIKSRSASDRERLMRVTPPMWPFAPHLWQPSLDLRENMAIAGAFAAYAIDRMNEGVLK